MGKPKEFEPNAEREPAPLDFSRLTTEQRQQMRELLEAMKATAAMPDGDAESAREQRELGYCAAIWRNLPGLGRTTGAESAEPATEPDRK